MMMHILILNVQTRLKIDLNWVYSWASNLVLANCCQANKSLRVWFQSEIQPSYISKHHEGKVWWSEWDFGYYPHHLYFLCQTGYHQSCIRPLQSSITPSSPCCSKVNKNQYFCAVQQKLKIKFNSCFFSYYDKAYTVHVVLFYHPHLVLVGSFNTCIFFNSFDFSYTLLFLYKFCCSAASRPVHVSDSS